MWTGLSRKRIKDEVRVRVLYNGMHSAYVFLDDYSVFGNVWGNPYRLALLKLITQHMGRHATRHKPAVADTPLNEEEYATVQDLLEKLLDAMEVHES